MSWPALGFFSPGTLQSAVRVVATRLKAPVNAIRRALVAAPVAHAAETGRRVNGNLYPIAVLRLVAIGLAIPPRRALLSGTIR